MKKIKSQSFYKDGYEISQANNNHVMICKDNEMVFHASCTREMTKEELEKQLEFYFMLIHGDDRI